MENKNGQGIFYGVIGVATLIVAIIGATFAYFSATATNNSTITGQTAQGASLTLAIEKVTDTNTTLIPLDVTPAEGGTSQLADALGTTGNSTKCTDKNGSNVCVVYKITVTNGGNAAIQVRGTLNLASDATGMKWALLADNGTTTSFPEYSTIQSVGAAQPITVTGNVTNPVGDGKAAASKTLAATGTTGDSADYYVLVWLEEAGSEQSDPDANKGFTGTVTFNSVAADGTTSGVTATFA